MEWRAHSAPMKRKRTHTCYEAQGMSANTQYPAGAGMTAHHAGLHLPRHQPAAAQRRLRRCGARGRGPPRQPQARTRPAGAAGSPGPAAAAPAALWCQPAAPLRLDAPVLARHGCQLRQRPASGSGSCIALVGCMPMALQAQTKRPTDSQAGSWSAACGGRAACLRQRPLRGTGC